MATCVSLVLDAVESCNVGISLVLNSVENRNMCISCVLKVVENANVCISLVLRRSDINNASFCRSEEFVSPYSVDPRNQ